MLARFLARSPCRSSSSRPFATFRELKARRTQYDSPPSKLNDLNLNLGQGTDWVDPRPAWLYRVASVGKWVTVPSIVMYMMFLHDYGDHEHVYMPLRRWLVRQKAKLFQLSPAELDMITREVKPPEPAVTT